ncbi:hypothetical protein X777_10468 [Ooceraea biroi]|uniref:Uncharacterized protein n=1 Tax=Ooceraea biroi TaxID=2015173 RepID=A0A026W421_OOCBI|nr:hypothetical protein X777_10468 [Ooceraea biroi]
MYLLLYLMMFSRAAKSIVNSFGSRQIHIGEKNFKIALIAGGAEEIGQTISQLLKTNNKLNIFALYNVVTINRFSPGYNTFDTYNFSDDQRFKFLPSGMLMTKKFCSIDVNRPNTAINNAKKLDNIITLNLSKHQENNGKFYNAVNVLIQNQTQRLVEALYRLPVAEEAPTLDSLLMANETISKF